VKRARPRLAFVSPLFLFPTDAGGKIRTSNILRGLKGGAFDVTLLSPALAGDANQWHEEIAAVCDDFVPWVGSAPQPKLRRGLQLFGDVPVNVAADRTAAGQAAVQAMVARGDIDVMVFDFVHASVLRPAKPARLPFKTVCFTHNVEAEIFARHATQARDPARRWMWTSQHAKMVKFEAAALRAYDKVIAVSERDAQAFHSSYGVVGAEAIPTGVDLDFFSWQAPPPVSDALPPTVVFTGSMDSAANIDGVKFFLTEVWPQVLAQLPHARLVVIGRRPPSALIALGQRVGQVAFTGFVDDVRPHLRAAHVSVIPLLVGGGTRIKAFEAMAMGLPVVSTALGIEGLDVRANQHYVEQDTAAGFADAVLHLLREPQARQGLSLRARACVDERFGHRRAAQAFEDICLRTLHAQRAAA
jgi:polysaccharide biosynthesis protein PslH